MSIIGYETSWQDMIKNKKQRGKHNNQAIATEKLKHHKNVHHQDHLLSVLHRSHHLIVIIIIIIIIVDYNGY
jgi:hypothetical protein